jgi:hypothetical protein
MHPRASAEFRGGCTLTNYFKVQSGDPNPVEVTESHRATSEDIVRKLCQEVSSSRPGERALHIRVGHFEQSGFLNPLLYGFWIMPILPGGDDPYPITGLNRLGRAWAAEAMQDWASEGEIDALLDGEGAQMQLPNESSEDSPSIWACIIDRTIEAQTESILTALAMLLERQQMSQRLMQSVSLADYPTEADRVDAEATKSIGDVVRTEGWRSAARAVRARAEAVNYSLHVEYRSPFLNVADIAHRMPAVRHVYNTLLGARDSIDRIVHTMTHGWRIKGPAPESALQTARDAIEGSGIQTLTALCARDALVCGVGALSLESVPLKEAWLVRPEKIRELDVEGKSALVSDETGTAKRISKILGLRGSSHPGLATGLSLLEPMVVTAAKRDLYLHSLLSSRVIAELAADLNSEIVSKAAAAEKLALYQLAEVAALSGVFSPVVAKLPAPPLDTYGDNQESMFPAVSRLSLGKE